MLSFPPPHLYALHLPVRPSSACSLSHDPASPCHCHHESHGCAPPTCPLDSMELGSMGRDRRQCRWVGASSIGPHQKSLASCSTSGNADAGPAYICLHCSKYNRLPPTCKIAPTIFRASWYSVSSSHCGFNLFSSVARRLCSRRKSVCSTVRAGISSTRMSP